MNDPYDGIVYLQTIIFDCLYLEGVLTPHPPAKQRSLQGGRSRPQRHDPDDVPATHFQHSGSAEHRAGPVLRCAKQLLAHVFAVTELPLCDQRGHADVSLFHQTRPKDDHRIAGYPVS